ncbi:MAG: cysteine desulfurase [Bdellovibrionales bacterium]|nr:cysteine desulfurase [Bdellovibrionales bacterium]
MDHHSTTPLDPEAFEVMKPYFMEKFGNASHGIHRFNWEAEAAVNLARAHLAAFIGGTEQEIIFTSGATESNHLALLGLAPELRKLGKTTILSIEIEHASLLGPLEMLTEQGFKVLWVKLQNDGRVDIDDLRHKLRTEPNVGLVSIAYANHEIGTIQPIKEISELTHAAGAIFHSDAVQAIGKIRVNVQVDGIDIMTMSAHKIHGPKGIGAIYVRRKKPRVELEALFRGGNQERGLRAGTPNTPAIVGFGKAAAILNQTMESEVMKLREMRDALWGELKVRLPCVIRNGSIENALPHNLSVSVVGVDGAAMLSRFKGFAVSSASACINGSQDYSQVLTVLGVSKELARATMRFGFGRFNRLDEVPAVAAEVAQVVEDLRQMEKEFAAQAGELESQDGECYK